MSRVQQVKFSTRGELTHVDHTVTQTMWREERDACFVAGNYSHYFELLKKNTKNKCLIKSLARPGPRIVTGNVGPTRPEDSDGKCRPGRAQVRAENLNSNLGQIP